MVLRPLLQDSGDSGISGQVAFERYRQTSSGILLSSTLGSLSFLAVTGFLSSEAEVKLRDNIGI